MPAWETCASVALPSCCLDVLPTVYARHEGSELLLSIQAGAGTGAPAACLSLPGVVHQAKVLEQTLEGVCLSRYGCTKWATEVQLQQLHQEYGVPVSIFRCGMILAHSKCDLSALTCIFGVAVAAVSQLP